MFRRLRAIVNLESLDTFVVDSMKETEQELLNLLRSQLSQGERGDGQMPQYANEKYAQYKQRIGSEAPFGVVDLKLSGDFQRKLRLIITKTGARIRSYDKKRSELLNKYSKEIYELNSENISVYVKEIFFPVLMKKIKDGMFK